MDKIWYEEDSLRKSFIFLNNRYHNFVTGLIIHFFCGKAKKILSYFCGKLKNGTKRLDFLLTFPPPKRSVTGKVKERLAIIFAWQKWFLTYARRFNSLTAVACTAGAVLLRKCALFLRALTTLRASYCSVVLVCLTVKSPTNNSW